MIEPGDLTPGQLAALLLAAERSRDGDTAILVVGIDVSMDILGPLQELGLVELHLTHGGCRACRFTEHAVLTRAGRHLVLDRLCPVCGQFVKVSRGKRELHFVTVARQHLGDCPGGGELVPNAELDDRLRELRRAHRTRESIETQVGSGGAVFDADGLPVGTVLRSWVDTRDMRHVHVVDDNGLRWRGTSRQDRDRVTLHPHRQPDRVPGSSAPEEK